jgi:hypothetical protein
VTQQTFFALIVMLMLQIVQDVLVLISYKILISVNKLALTDSGLMTQTEPVNLAKPTVLFA